MYTYSLSLFVVLTKSTMTTEKRLMIDLKTVKESYSKMEIDYIAYMKSEYNIAYTVTKLRTEWILLRTLNSSLIDHPIGK